MSLIFSFITLLLVFGGILTVIFFNTNPYDSGFLTQFSFYVSLIISMFSLFSLSGMIYLNIKKTQFSKLRFFRRTLLISLTIAGLIILSSLKVLNAMSAIAFILTMILLEFFFASKRIEKALK